MDVRWYLVLICFLLRISNIEHLFIYFVTDYMYLLWNMSVHVLFPFLISLFGLLFLLSCRSSLHILDINPLSDKWFASIFSHAVGCSLTLLFSSMHRNFQFSYRTVYLSTFTFVTYAFDTILFIFAFNLLSSTNFSKITRAKCIEIFK